MSIRGSLRREERPGAAPLLTAILEGEAIDLEDLRAIQALTGEGSGSVAGHDLDLTLKTALLRADGMEAADVDVELRMERGSVSVDRLNAGAFYGARIESSGKIDDLFGRASGNMSLAIQAEDGSGLVNLARERLGENRFLDALAIDPALTADLDITLSLDARPEGEGAKASLNATGAMGGARFELHDAFEGRPAQWGEARHGITAKISHDAPDVLARQFSLPALPLPPDGPVTVDIELSGRPLERMEGLVALAAPGSDVSASGSLSFKPGVATGAPDLSRPAYEARVTAGIKDADPWLFMFGLVLPGAGEGTPLSLSADARGGDGTHAFTGISGQFSGNGYSGALTLAIPPAGRSKLTGNLAFDALSLPVLAEFVTGPGTFGQSFDGLSEAEFQPPPLPGIDGELALSAQRLETGFSEAAEGFSAQAAMIEGALTLSQVSAKWLGGQYSGSISLNNLAGNATADLRGTVAGFRPVACTGRNWPFRGHGGQRAMPVFRSTPKGEASRDWSPGSRAAATSRCATWSLRASGKAIWPICFLQRMGKDSRWTAPA